MPTPTLTYLFLLFCASLLVGSLRTMRALVTARQTRPAIDTLQAWSERPLSSVRYEPHSSAAILLHTLAVALLAVAALDAASNARGISTQPGSSDATTYILLWIAEGGSIALVGYLAGSLIAFPLARLRKTPASVGITEDGVVYGNSLLPWRWFSHYSIDRRESLLRLYSAFAPDLASFISRPGASISQAELQGILQQYLRTTPTDESRKWYRTRFLLIPTMLLVCTLLLAVGWIATDLPRELALFVIALATTTLYLLGGRIVTLFGFGVFTIRREKVGRPPVA